jgi:hypothetical protein
VRRSAVTLACADIEVMVSQHRVDPVHENRSVVVGDRVVELDKEHESGGCRVHHLRDGRDELVTATQARERLVDGGDDLDLGEFLTHD